MFTIRPRAVSRVSSTVLSCCRICSRNACFSASALARARSASSAALRACRPGREQSAAAHGFLASLLRRGTRLRPPPPSPARPRAARPLRLPGHSPPINAPGCGRFGLLGRRAALRLRVSPAARQAAAGGASSARSRSCCFTLGRRAALILQPLFLMPLQRDQAGVFGCLNCFPRDHRSRLPLLPLRNNLRPAEQALRFLERIGRVLVRTGPLCDLHRVPRFPQDKWASSTTRPACAQSRTGRR